MVRTQVVTPELESWQELQIQYPNWDGILVGNGASRAVWDRFAYRSLYEQACSSEIARPLSAADRALFSALKTENFEQVLFALRTAMVVERALGRNTSHLEAHYESVRQALIDAVHSVHVRRADIPDATLHAIRGALAEHRAVYSTNYDLLLYWAIMSKDGGNGFKDYFWGSRREFDVRNTELWGQATRVLYLHGALHLYLSADDRTGKKASDPFDGSLLDTFGITPADSIPLFVSEGTADDKLDSIRRNDYLNFALLEFSRHRSSLVIFGQSLGPSDQHVVDAMRAWQEPRIAVSMLKDQAEEIVRRKASYIAALPNAELFFFDAASHPLGQPTLRIEV